MGLKQREHGQPAGGKRPPDAPVYRLDVRLCGEPLIEPEADALDVPGQKLCDAVDGMIGDALDYMSQIAVGSDRFVLRVFDKVEAPAPTHPPCVGAGEFQIARAEG